MDQHELEEQQRRHWRELAEQLGLPLDPEPESALAAPILPAREEPAPEPADPPAVVFVDITGYTTITEQRGDEAAVHIASGRRGHTAVGGAKLSLLMARWKSKCRRTRK